jgi:hypothetical protein
MHEGWEEAAPRLVSTTGENWFWITFRRHHVNVLGRYSFALPEMPGGLRPLRDPDDAGGA